MKQNAQANPIEEAKRYLANAKDILRTKGGNGVPGYYSDAKYVKMACNTAWSGVLVALDSKLSHKTSKNRKSVETYKEYLSTRNRKTFNDFLSAYNYLHLLGEYDGDLNKKTAQTGLDLAQKIIELCKRN